MNKTQASILLNATRQVLNGLTMMTRETHAAHWGEDELWKELVACILGSVVPFEMAQTYTDRLHSVGLLNEAQRADNFLLVERRLSKELSRPTRQLREDHSPTRYRFPNLRAKQIRRTAEAIYGKGNTLQCILSSCCNENTARDKIVNVTCGIGPKQASLFLRNTGYAQRLAILDVHVLRFMSMIGITDTALSSVSTVSSYERLERRFLDFADAEGANVGLLDTAIWVVMRVYQREDARCRS